MTLADRSSGTGLILVGILLALPVGSGSSGESPIVDPLSRPPATPGPVFFEDVAAAAGVLYQQHAPRIPPDCMLTVDRFTGFCQSDRMTGGAAVGDVDGDGDPDLFVTRLDAPDILFRNKGDGTFEDGSTVAGFDNFDLQSNAAVFADIDNDGDPDLYVTVVGNEADPVNNRNYLFINDGNGAFSEEAVSRGADVSSGNFHRSFSAAFGDFDRDGWLDLHVTEWGPPNPSHSRLLRNLGDSSPGHFEDVTIAAGASLEGVFGFSTTFTDLDQDGWPDLAVAGDFGTSQLLWNNRDGTFTNGTVAAQVGTDENGMGSTFGDFDGDGDLDWFVTSIYDPDVVPCNPNGCFWAASGNRLFRNDGNRTFSDATDSADVRNGHWGWGAAFFDFDNDADLDLVMTNGVDFPSLDVDDVFSTDPMRAWENDGSGSMTEISATVGLTDTASGKGLLVFDYDRDGDLDVFVVNNGGQPRLYRNTGGNGGDWLRVNTVGVNSNSEGLGAKITLQQEAGGAIQVREVGTSTHFLGQSERTVHFGLMPGSGSVALVRIVWPSGREQSLTDVPRNLTLTVVEEGVFKDGFE